MRRIHLFELEDFDWFPVWLRNCMTRLLVVVHRILGTSNIIAPLIDKALRESNASTIIDLCSGSGGAMLDIKQVLNQKYGLNEVPVILTDLYPDEDIAKVINKKEKNISYRTSSVDAIRFENQIKGLRTMVGSFHHMKPNNAKKILESAQHAAQPISIFEIRYNYLPPYLWWISFPFIFVIPFFLTPMVKPITWKQLIFTYVIPIIPVCFAWDGAVSSARIYTLKDLDELVNGIESTDYRWEKGTAQGTTKLIYLLGIPNEEVP